mmetsp:Transcript_15184/g.57271  ORF Transcript_15184/g.57271 Transcript_15184/m.57271 type:complete len:227 (+) Transcript_15184:729-1409(+)
MSAPRERTRLPGRRPGLLRTLRRTWPLWPFAQWCRFAKWLATPGPRQTRTSRASSAAGVCATAAGTGEPWSRGVLTQSAAVRTLQQGLATPTALGACSAALGPTTMRCALACCSGGVQSALARARARRAPPSTGGSGPSAFTTRHAWTPACSQSRREEQLDAVSASRCSSLARLRNTQAAACTTRSRESSLDQIWWFRGGTPSGCRRLESRPLPTSRRRPAPHWLP